MIRRLLNRLGRVRSNWPLATQLVVAVLAVLVPTTVAVTVIVVAILQNTISEQVGNNLYTIAQSTARRVADQLAQEVNNLDTLARSQAVVADVQTANTSYPASEAIARQELDQMTAQWTAAQPNNPLVLDRQSLTSSIDLRNFANRYPDNVEVFVTDRYGGLVAITTPPEAFAHSDEVWWTLAYNSGIGAVYISPPEFEPVSNLYTIVIAVPIYQPNSREVIGILHARYRLQALINQLTGVDVGVTGEAMLFSESGLRLDTTSTEEIRIPEEEWRNMLDAQWHIGEFQSQQSMVAQAFVLTDVGPSDINNLGWAVIIRQNVNESLAASLAVVRAAGVIGVIGLIIAIVFTIFVARALVQPLAELTRLAKEAQSGNLNVNVPMAGRDEIGQLSQAFNSMISEIRASTGVLEEKVAERTTQLAAINEIAATVSSTLEIDEVMDLTVNLIRDRLGFYHVSIFLLDEEGETAILRESTGEVGRQLKERGHRLGVGSQSIMGYVTANRKPRIALDVGSDTVHFKNPLLPNTRSEMGLPLIVGDTLLGALDVQSTLSKAFDTEDVAVLQSMANQIAVAINNARLFKEAQTRLAEISLLSRQYLSEAWDNYSRSHPETVSLRLEGNTVEPAPDEAMNGDPLSLTQPYLSNDGTEMFIPITLRGQVIGEFMLSAPNEDRQWTQDELRLAEAVIAQAALAVENARLLEETQSALAETKRLARRERVISEVTSKIAFGSDVKRILQIAAEELQRATGSSRAVVRLTSPSREGA
ncbi:MAG: GAF domain-containing protein [Chloroflexi bacterium]|nr:GAF domain-containing protein [Chloroflexota bacterium]